MQKISKKHFLILYSKGKEGKVDISSVSDEDIAIMKTINSIKKEYSKDIKYYADGYYHVRTHDNKKQHLRAKTIEGIYRQIYNYLQKHELTVAGLYSMFYSEWQELHKKQSTLDAHHLQWKKHIQNSNLATVYVDEISKKDIISWCKEFQKKNYQKLSKKDVSNCFSTINALFLFARGEQLTDFAPNQYLKDYRKINIKDDFYKIEKSLPIDEVLSEEEDRELIDYFMKQNNLFAKAALLSRFTALRPGEVLALKPEDINIQSHQLFVKRTEVYDSVNGTHIRYSPKGKGRCKSTGEYVPVELSDDALAILDDIFKLRNKNSEWLFVQEGQDNRIIRPNLSRYISKSSKSLGQRSHNTRSMRKTYATESVQNGMSLNLLANQMGHVNIKTAMDKYVGNGLSRDEISIQINRNNKIKNS